MHLKSILKDVLHTAIVSGVRQVTDSPSNTFNGFLRHLLTIIGQSKSSKEVYDDSGHVDTGTPLTGSIVVRKGMVVVVVAFTNGSHTHKSVVTWIRVLIISPAAPEVGCTVDEPR